RAQESSVKRSPAILPSRCAISLRLRAVYAAPNHNGLQWIAVRGGTADKNFFPGFLSTTHATPRGSRSQRREISAGAATGGAPMDESGAALAKQKATARLQ